MPAEGLTSRFDQALVFASELHRVQRRKGTSIPYVSHLLAVAGLVIEHGGDEDQAIAALLHDAIEDQGGEAIGQDIRRKFGETVHAIVLGCSDTSATPKPPWKARKTAYIAHVREAGLGTKIVSAADKLHNARAILSDLREMGELVWERFTGSKQETLWYYRALVEAYRAGNLPRHAERLVDELDRTVAEIERLSV